MTDLLKLACLTMLCVPALAEAREWHDISGHFKIEAELVGSHDTKAVLKTTKGNLLVIETEQLCPADRAYITSTEAKELLEKKLANDPAPSFTLVNGLEVQGVVAGFAVHAWDIRKKNGRVYLNEVQYNKLPKVYRELLPAVVSHFEQATLTTFSAVNQWLEERGNSSRSYHVDSVALRTTKKELVYIPLIMFGEHSRSRFKEDFKYWANVQEAKIDKAEKESYEREESLRLQYKYQLEALSEARNNYYRSVQLGLLSLATGVTKLWEVSIINPNGYSAPISVIVSAPDSGMAEAMVLMHYPGMQLNSTRVLAGF